MTLISYAQNSEDVLLWRALGHIKNGFYIDAGANDPVDHSVTKAFYDAGWHGINIEPLPALHQAFREQRPRDINLAVAAGARDGSIALFDVPSVNGWASSEREVADAHRAEGFEVTEITVPMRTLAGICAEHVRGDIHFLKIDVEGFEGEVLRGMDFARWRPWILVIEATLPNSRVTNHETWEPLVTSQRYHYAYFDGLNRYYVADEHKELLEALSIQPNVFDDFISHHLDKAWAATAAASKAGGEAEARAVHAETRLREAEKRAGDAMAAARESSILSNVMFEKFEDASARALQALEGKAAAQAEVASLREALASAQIDGHRALASAQIDGHQALMWARGLEQQLVATHRSASWRITRPLRGATRLVRFLARGALLKRVALRVTANERMRRLLIPILLRFPSLGARVSQTLSAIRQGTPEATAAPGEAHVPEELKALPVSARKVLADLQRRRTAPRT